MSEWTHEDFCAAVQGRLDFPLACDLQPLIMVAAQYRCSLSVLPEMVKELMHAAKCLHLSGSHKRRVVLGIVDTFMDHNYAHKNLLRPFHGWTEDLIDNYYDLAIKPPVFTACTSGPTTTGLRAAPAESKEPVPPSQQTIEFTQSLQARVCFNVKAELLYAIHAIFTMDLSQMVARIPMMLRDVMQLVARDAGHLAGRHKRLLVMAAFDLAVADCFQPASEREVLRDMARNTIDMFYKLSQCTTDNPFAQLAVDMVVESAKCLCL